MCKYTPLKEGVMDLLTHFQTIEKGKGRAYLDPVMKPGPTRVTVRMPRITKVM